MYYNHHDERSHWESYDDAYRYDYDENQEVDEYDVEAYLKAGFDLAEAHDWLGIRCLIVQARQYAALGVTPDEAAALAGFPIEAWAFKQAGFAIETAKHWHVHGFAPEEADIWSRAGWLPEQAAHVRGMYDDAGGAAIAWAFTGLSAQEAIERVEACESPLPFLSLPNCTPPELEATDLLV